MYFFNKTLILTSGAHALTPGNLFLGDLPPKETFYVLKGNSDSFSSVRFVQGSFLNQGSLVIGSLGPGGILQVLDLNSREVLSYTVSGELVSDNIEDVVI